MAAHSIIIFTMSMCCLYLIVDGRNVRQSAGEESFQPLCSRMCSLPEDSRDRIIPPYRCSCSPSCAVFGDCCYDSPYKDTKRPSEFDFVCLSVYGRGEFQALSSCPPHKRSETCRGLLGYVPPVTSRVTNITYANAFCALCNDDGNNLVRWNVQLKCSLESDRLDFGLSNTRIIYNLDKFWMRNGRKRTWGSCKFHLRDDNFLALERLELRPCDSDVPKRESRCSWTWRDLSVEQKCRSYEDPVYIRNKGFRNSHCAECNYMNLNHAECGPRFVKEMLHDGSVDEHYIQSCMATSPYRCLFDLGRGIRYNLSPIFKPEEEAIKDEGCLPPKNRRCCEGERFNPLIGECRKTRRA